jgi:DNA mismatch endonuclease (patch repair protein)
MDIISKEKRSWNMSRIRSKDTKPEMIVRSLLHRMGYRFRLHVKDLPGKPDIVLPKYKTVIFVHGCFWHQHKNCKYAYKPQSRINFWEEKLSSNADRDKKIHSELKTLGWNVIVIWECELSKQDSFVNKLARHASKLEIDLKYVDEVLKKIKKEWKF